MIDVERLKSVLDYDCETGLFRWKAKTSPRSNRIVVGSVAGNVNKVHGYAHIKVDGVLYPAHRLAWLYVYGEMPSVHIDHINRKRSDNRIVNLRLATRQENARNKSLSRKNSTGVTGVIYRERDGKRPHYEARIGVNGKRKFLGCFETLDEAKLARQKAMEKYKYESNHGAK